MSSVAMPVVAMPGKKGLATVTSALFNNLAGCSLSGCNAFLLS